MFHSQGLALLIRFAQGAGKFLLWMSAVLLGVISVSLIILGMRLSSGPIELDFLPAKIEKILEQKNAPFVLSVHQPRLTWEGWASPLNVVANDVHLHSRDKGEHLLSIPQLKLSFKIKGLFKGKWLPTVLRIEQPHLSLIRRENGAYGIAIGEMTEEEPEDYSSLLAWLMSTHPRAPLRVFKEINIEGGVIDIVDRKIQKKWHIPSVALSLERDHSAWQLAGEIALEKAKAHFEGLLQLPAKGRSTLAGLRLQAKGEVHNLPMRELEKWWLPSLAPLPRAWVLENITHGFVPKASVAFDFNVAESNEEPLLQINKIEGDIQFKDMTVNYLDGLPKVFHVDGNARFDKQNFYIMTSSGQMRNLRVLRSDMIIKGMDAKDQNMIIDVEVEGPLQDTLLTLDQKPLEFIRRFGIQPRSVAGQVKGTLHFAFPVETTLAIEDVDVKAQANLKNVTIPELFGYKTHPLAIQQGNFQLALDSQHLEVKGPALLNKMRAAIQWEERFKPEKDWRSHYKVAVHMGAEDAGELGLPKFSEMEVPLEIDYRVFPNEPAKLAITSDLTPSDFILPGFGSIKSKGEKGALVIKASLQKNQMKALDALIIKTPSFALQGAATFDSQGSLATLKFPVIQFKENHLHLTGLRQQGKLHLYLRAPKLDIQPLLEQWDLSQETTAAAPPLLMHVDIDHLYSGKEMSLGFFKGQAESNGHAWNKIHIDCRSGDDKTPWGNLTVLRGVEKNQDTLRIYSSHAANLLRALGLYSKAKKGALKIKALKVSEKDWEGKLRLTNFYLSDAPFLTHLLSLASPFGLFDIVSDKGLFFDRLSAQFKLTPTRIIFSEGQAAGMSLGLTMSGSYDRKGKQVHLHGSIIPAYMFTSLLSKIPLVGELLGGAGGILGISYSIDGDIQQPKMNVNPLSAFAPGFLRRLFDPEDPFNKEDEEGIQ